MKRWRGDTLFLRLFVLMWLALAGSHLAAFLTVRGVHAPPGGPGGPLPVLGSLPPGSLPASALWLDYAIRLAVIGLAAWWGARWLSAPMQRLSAAAQALGGSMRPGQPLPKLDEQRGTLEVRTTALVFNTMAERLREEFDARGLHIAAISHDLRTPLTRLRLRIERLPQDGLTLACARDIHEIDTMIDGALDVLREQREATPAQRVDVQALVQAMVDDLAEQGHALLFDGRPAVARARPAALRRVLGNLVGNALRYSPHGDVQIQVQSLTDGVLVTVDDRGPGIAPEQLETAFTPWVRLGAAGDDRDAGAGNGLGLHVARTLAEHDGARLNLSNRPGGGLRAQLLLRHA